MKGVWDISDDNICKWEEDSVSGENVWYQNFDIFDIFQKEKCTNDSTKTSIDCVDTGSCTSDIRFFGLCKLVACRGLSN